MSAVQWHVWEMARGPWTNRGCSAVPQPTNPSLDHRPSTAQELFKCIPPHCCLGRQFPQLPTESEPSGMFPCPSVLVLKYSRQGLQHIQSLLLTLRTRDHQPPFPYPRSFAAIAPFHTCVLFHVQKDGWRLKQLAEGSTKISNKQICSWLSDENAPPDFFKAEPALSPSAARVGGSCTMPQLPDWNFSSPTHSTSKLLSSPPTSTAVLSRSSSASSSPWDRGHSGPLTEPPILCYTGLSFFHTIVTPPSGALKSLSSLFS